MQREKERGGAETVGLCAPSLPTDGGGWKVEGWKEVEGRGGVHKDGKRWKVEVGVHRNGKRWIVEVGVHRDGKRWKVDVGVHRDGKYLT